MPKHCAICLHQRSSVTPDDTAVHSPDAWSHLRVLRKVLAVFRAAGLQISPGKAQLFRDHIKYLGHEISTRGISIPLEYTSVVKEWPIPDTLKALRAFLGKCGYYRRFIKNYATISTPLVQYTQQEQHEGIPHPPSRHSGHPSLPPDEEEADVCTDTGLPPVSRRTLHPGHRL